MFGDFANRRPRIIVQVVEGRNVDVIRRSGANEVICVKDIQAKMMSQGCLCYGLCPLIGNLFRSLDLNNTEYADGCDFEIYRVPFSEQFWGISYVACAHFLYVQKGLKRAKRVKRAKRAHH